jgi:hypothetical protein
MIPADLPRRYSNCRLASLTCRPRFPPAPGCGSRAQARRWQRIITVATVIAPKSRIASAILGVYFRSLSMVQARRYSTRQRGRHRRAVHRPAPAGPARGKLKPRIDLLLREGRSSNAEVDFVAAFELQIVQIEAKAGGRGSSRSLHRFVGEKHVPPAVRFDSNPPSMQLVSATIQTGDQAAEVKYRLLSLPLYLVEKVADVLRDLPSEAT